MSRRQILFVSGEYPPQSGGVGDYTALLGRALQRKGLDVRIITDLEVISGDYSGDYPQGYPQIRRWSWQMIGQVAHFADEIRADWIHVQYQTAAFDMHPAINVAPLFWRRRNLRVAWTYHDLRVPYLFPKAGSYLRRQVTLLPARTSHLTIVTNTSDALELARIGVPHHRIPIGSNIKGRKLNPEGRRRRRALRGFGDGDLVVGFFGFLNPEKGGELLIDVVARLRRMRLPAHLLMIGERVGASDSIHGDYIAAIEARIQAADLTPYVTWTGHQKESEVSADLNAIDLLLLPYAEGMSLSHGTLMAGLRNGCAIVTSEPDYPIAEVKSDRDLLTFPAGDVDGALAAVLRIAQNETLAARLRTNARQASRHFTWQQIAANHIELYA